MPADSSHQVAIIVACNCTEGRRQYIIERAKGKVEYMFVETICDDEAVNRKFMALRITHTPDYTNWPEEQVWHQLPCQCVVLRVAYTFCVRSCLDQCGAEPSKLATVVAGFQGLGAPHCQLSEKLPAGERE